MEPGDGLAERHRRAKQPIASVAGPYGHPVHPILVTIPIGTWLASFIFDIASQQSGETYAPAAMWLIFIGLIGALAAAFVGVLDLLAIPRSTPAFRVGLTHLMLSATVMVVYTVSFYLRRGEPPEAPTSAGLLALSVAALVILAATGWMGGKLAYRFGVRVAEEEDQRAGFVYESAEAGTAESGDD